MPRKKFTFVDLFAGIGGFHATLSAMGGECVLAVENNPAAARIYESNWGINPFSDITNLANEDQVSIPDHDVLCAGFPCQPFSKSGAQKGMDETRGTLYWNILRIVQEKKPSVILLENVRNLAGPRHRHEWQIIVETLREEGYRISEQPAIFSPHLLPPELGGRPQHRERVFITASRLDEGIDPSSVTYPVVSNQPVGGWSPKTWNLIDDLPLENFKQAGNLGLTDSEVLWIDAWDDFVALMRKLRDGRRLPGFPLWADEWIVRSELTNKRLKKEPDWKANYLIKNSEFYTAYQKEIDKWAKKWNLYSEDFPPSRRKLEWQAQDTESLWDSIIHFRPSGIRAKAPSYLPALVAITQTSVIASRRRRLSIREAARLQGLPDWFDFGDQADSLTYRQLGNGVSIGALWHVVREHVKRDEEVLKITNPGFMKAVLGAGENPDSVLTDRS